MDNNDMQSALKKALEMEEKGHKFYKDAADKNLNEITKRTFNFLAENETEHIKDIKNFSKSLEAKGELPDLKLENIKDKRLDELKIFSKSISDLNEKIKPSDDDKKACEFAMEFENSGYKYYESMLKTAKDANLIKLLKFLLGEESKHYESLKGLYEYLTDSKNWFMYEEGSFPQG